MVAPTTSANTAVPASDGCTPSLRMTSSPEAKALHGAMTELPRRRQPVGHDGVQEGSSFRLVAVERVHPHQRNVVGDGIEHLVDGRRDLVGAAVLIDVVGAEGNDPQLALRFPAGGARDEIGHLHPARIAGRRHGDALAHLASIDTSSKPSCESSSSSAGVDATVIESPIITMRVDVFSTVGHEIGRDGLDVAEVRAETDRGQRRFGGGGTRLGAARGDTRQRR